MLYSGDSSYMMVHFTAPTLTAVTSAWAQFTTTLYYDNSLIVFAIILIVVYNFFRLSNEKSTMLGVTISNKLSVGDHVTNTISKCSQDSVCTDNAAWPWLVRRSSAIRLQVSRHQQAAAVCLQCLVRIHIVCWPTVNGSIHPSRSLL